jgi:hypothetical protein
MRQVAHSCVTLRHSRHRKDAENVAFRPLFGRKSAVESAKWRKGPPAQRLTPSLQMLQKCSIVAHSVHSASHPKLRRNSRNSFRPPPFAARRFAVTGFPRSHGPPKDIVNHQTVNVRLKPLRATAAEADEKIRWNFRSEPKLPERVDRWRMRQGGAYLRHFASLLWPKRRRNRRFSSPFGPKIGGRTDKAAKKPAGAKAYAESTDATKV